MSRLSTSKHSSITSAAAAPDMDRIHRRAQLVVRSLLVAAVAALTLQASSVVAHNLGTQLVYMYPDPATQALLDSRVNNTGTPLLMNGDEIGLIIKVVPQDGTTTGVGGHVDFYVPNGVTVVGAQYVVPDGLGGFAMVPMKGQSPIAIGDGTVGATTTANLVGLTLGPNINGVTEAATTGTGLHRGTIAGVYGDTGIFYSTSPDTAYGSWVASGGFDQNTGTGGDNAIRNNDNEVMTPYNKWDAEQMLGFGVRTTPLAAPVIDPVDGRGNAPWGVASGVAGPQSGYGWDFDWDFWRTSGMTAADARASLDQFGPWNRIRYPGSRISQDQAGLISNVIGFANVDGSGVGTVVSPGSPLPSTVSQTDLTSPKAIRWAIGQLTEFQPEYVLARVRIDNASALLGATGCPEFHADTFGGDAGGADVGKDHLWRYYLPSATTWNGCTGIGKQGDKEAVLVGDTLTYTIRYYNLGTTTLNNVVVRDQLPAQVSFVSAVPAQNSGPNPLAWNLGTMMPGEKFEAVVTVTVTGTPSPIPILHNVVTVTSDELPPQMAVEDTPVGPRPLLQLSKTVSSDTVSPGGTVIYTLVARNVGTGPTNNPVSVTDFLPADFSYVSLNSVLINAVNVTGGTTVDASNPNQPKFSVPGAINAGQELRLQFTAAASPNILPGTYCNVLQVTQNQIPITTGSQACVRVPGGENPVIGIAKAVGSVTNHGDGSYTVVYNLLVRNYGDVALSNLQVTDNLATTFAGATGFSMASSSSPDFAANPSYTGSPPNINLLLGSDTLGIGAQGSIQVSVRVVPGANLGPYFNTAVASGRSPAGTSVTDNSHDGLNPDPDQDDDPTNNGIPTPVEFDIVPTAATLSSFTAEARPAGGTLVRWTTAFEVDVLGFNIYRADSLDGRYTQMNGELIAATGGSVQGDTYRFLDLAGALGHHYELEIIASGGFSERVGPVAVRGARPTGGRRIFLPLALSAALSGHAGLMR